MSQSLFSQSWYRVADLKPRLRPHARLHRQQFRKQVWYVLQDSQSGRFHRLSPAAHHILCLMDGRRTVREIWEQVGSRLPDEVDQPTQDETIQLLGQLHAADLLLGEVPPDMRELSHRARRQKQRNLLMKVRNPLAVRFPLLDPNRFLDHSVSLVRPLFTIWGLLLWGALIAAGLIIVGVNWTELTANLSDGVLTVGNLAILLLVYPLVKAVHELGHAYATKVWGGEVHEMGLMLLVLIPVPYVDASASSAFQSKWRRAVVGGAGIMVEAAVAAIAAVVWVTVEPGLVRAVAFNVMLIGGISTLLFNGNPLLRFDGYYVFTDLIEVPNLGTRANKYVFYLLQRYGFGLEDTASPVTAESERGWLLFYAVASFFYRFVIMMSIAVFVGTSLFMIGVALAIWAVANMLLFPVIKGLKFLLQSPKLNRHRRRATAVMGAVVAAVLAFFFVLPLPYGTLAEGVVWLPDRASVRAQTAGFVVSVLADSDVAVTQGEALFGLEDPALAARIAVLEAQLRELRLRYEAVRFADRVQANILGEQIAHIRGAIADSSQRLAALQIRAQGDGRFIALASADLPGRFVSQGDVLGYVVGDGDPVVRVVVPQSDVDLVRRRTRKVEVRFVEQTETPIEASIMREVPTGANELPSPALSTEGGGRFALDPQSSDAPLALETLFQFDLAVPVAFANRTIGGRVYVRFDHGLEPLGFRLARNLRQLFLRQFSV